MSESERKIVQLREVEPDNAKRYTPRATLLDAVGEIDAETLQPTKCILLFLDDDGHEKYNTRYYQSGMSMSECIALLEVMKIRFMREMGVVPGGV